jgi:hypothetical protein
LKGDGVYVGEVTVLSPVKGAAWDSGGATLEASTIATEFWEFYSTRRDLVAQVG